MNKFSDEDLIAYWDYLLNDGRPIIKYTQVTTRLVCSNGMSGIESKTRAAIFINK